MKLLSEFTAVLMAYSNTENVPKSQNIQGQCDVKMKRRFVKKIRSSIDVILRRQTQVKKIDLCNVHIQR